MLIICSVTYQVVYEVPDISGKLLCQLLII